MIEARGFAALLVNARESKGFAGCKSDVNDAQWLQQLDQYGFLRASFHPPRDIAALRVVVPAPP